MTHFQMYLILKADSMIRMAALIGVFALVACFITMLVAANYGGWDSFPWRKLVWAAITSVIVFCSAFFIPSTKDIALIYAVPTIIGNEDVQAIPPELAKLARAKIDEMLKETKE